MSSLEWACRDSLLSGGLAHTCSTGMPFTAAAMESASKDTLWELDPTLAQAFIISSKDGFSFGSTSMISQQSSLALSLANWKIKLFLASIFTICFTIASCSLSINCRHGSLTPF